MRTGLRRPRGWAAVVPGSVAVAAVGPDGGALSVTREQVNPGDYRLVTAVAGEDVWFHVLSLPTSEAKEVRQMLDLQMDSLTPLPLEDVVTGHEVLAVNGGESRVLVAVARKSAVNERVAALEAEGLPVEVVGVDVLAIWRGCREAGALAADEKLNAFVYLTATTAQIVVYSGGEPRAIRVVMAGAGEHDLLIAELQRTLLSLESATGVVTFATWDDELRSVAEQLRQRWPGMAECLAVGKVPGPLACLCRAAAVEGALNLLPEEWRERRSRAQRRALMVRAGAIAGVVYAVGLAVFLVAMLVQQSRVARVKSETAQLRPQYTAARQLHSTLVAMQLQLDDKYSALEVLREVSQLMPESLKLTGFTFKKDQTVTLRGQTPAAGTANEFIGRLERCAMFGAVKTVSVRTEGNLTKFEVVGTLKSATAGGATWR